MEKFYLQKINYKSVPNSIQGVSSDVSASFLRLKLGQQSIDYNASVKARRREWVQTEFGINYFGGPGFSS